MLVEPGRCQSALKQHTETKARVSQSVMGVRPPAYSDSPPCSSEFLPHKATLLVFMSVGFENTAKNTPQQISLQPPTRQLTHSGLDCWSHSSIVNKRFQSMRNFTT